MSYVCFSKGPKKKYVTELIQNKELLKLRLTEEEKSFYINLFYDNSIGEKVPRDKFYPLLGLLGTNISQEFADRIFLTFSSNTKEISLCEYLKYLDIYHYGDEKERCTVTCKLMDRNNKGEIDFADFKSYIVLILNAVTKVNSPTDDCLMSENDIKDLFYLISNKKETFTYADFENIYREKPQLVSWFDYFKNNKTDSLLIINEKIDVLIKMIQKFLSDFIRDLYNILINNQEIDIKKIATNVFEYSKELENVRIEFLNKINQFNIRSILDDLKTENQQDSKDYLIKLKNKLFKSIKIPINDNIDHLDHIDTIEKKLHESIKNKFIYENSNTIKTDNENIARSRNFENKDDELVFSSERNNLNENPNLMSKNTIIETNNIKINEGEKFKRNDRKVSGTELTKNLVSKKSLLKSFLDKFRAELTTQKKENGNKNVNLSKKPTIIKKSINDFNKEDDKNKHRLKTFKLKSRLQSIVNYYENRNPKQEEEKKNNYIENLPIKNTEEDLKTKNYIVNTETTNSNNNLNNININKDKEKMKKSINLSNINIDLSHYESDYDSTINNGQDIESEFISLSNKKLPNKNDIHKKDSKKTSIRKSIIDNSNQPLKQLLFCSLTLMQNSLSIFKTFSICYKWISENYLKTHIKKKLKEEKLKKNKRRKPENVPKKIKPVKIKTSDQSFKLLLNMIMGIQKAVGQCPNMRLDNIDINSKEGQKKLKEYVVNVSYSIQTINFGLNQEESFSLKELAPVIFNNIRLYLGINKESFISSISPEDFITELLISGQFIFEELCSTGNSGSLFYYTRDGKFIVKTIRKKEYIFLKEILLKYYIHLKSNSLSLLPKFLGCYALTKKVKRKKQYIYFIVMMNVFCTTNHIDVRYDLKGSKIGRRVLKGTAEDELVYKNDLALKDLDFESNKVKVNIDKKRNIILSQIKEDSDFLAKIGANDYSLLLGIHNIDNGENDESADLINADKISEMTSYSGGRRLQQLKEMVDYEDGGILSENGSQIYYLGIIDILTDFGFAKKMEHFVKMMRYCSNKMSCIPPDLYGERFYNYMRNTVFKEYEDQKSGASTKRNLLKENNKDYEINSNEPININENEIGEKNNFNIECKGNNGNNVNELNNIEFNKNDENY